MDARLSLNSLPARLRSWGPLLVAAVVLVGSPTWGNSPLQDTTTDKSKSDATAAKDADEEAAEVDPFEVPDGTVKELFDYITETMKGNRGRDRAEIPKAARAVVDAAAKIRTLDGVTVEEELDALKQMIPALSFLARSDSEAAAEMKKMMEALSKSDKPKLKALGMQQLLQAEIQSLRSMSEEDREEFIVKVKTLMDETGASMETYTLGSQLARGLQSAGADDLAVLAYVDLADRLEGSDDEKIQGYAARARGSARRLDLMGNEMELTGPTDRGEPLEWASYRGKVVLVDFWASWCGPCRAEIPNMKRNLEAYAGDFDIVGINMDNTAEAMKEYIADEDIGWVNLIGEPETGMGWDHPIARYYGVSGIPTAILVDRDGKVVSLSARGKRLDALLADMIGPLPKIEGEDSDEE